MLFESFASEVLDSNSQQRHDQADELRTLLISCEFDALLDWHQKFTTSFYDAVLDIFPELTGSQLAQWQRYFPTQSQPSEYNLELLPLDALRVIYKAAKLTFFDGFVVWTTPGNSYWSHYYTMMGKNHEDTTTCGLESLAVGYREIDGHIHYYPLVRWGKSLYPTAAIKNRVRWIRLGTGLTLPFFVLCAVIIASCLYIVTNRHHPGGKAYTTSFYIIDALALTIAAKNAAAIIVIKLQKYIGPKPKQHEQPV